MDLDQGRFLERLTEQRSGTAVFFQALLRKAETFLRISLPSDGPTEDDRTEAVPKETVFLGDFNHLFGHGLRGFRIVEMEVEPSTEILCVDDAEGVVQFLRQGDGLA